MDEFGIIERYFSKLAKCPESIGLTDDTAIIDNKFAITKDILISDVHFFKNDDPYFIAKKALRVNLSDLAAVGATPKFILLGLGINETEEWIARFSEGLQEDLDFYNCCLIGGDTTKSKHETVISITAIGELTSKPLLRSNAQIGDLLCVTGTLGESAIGLKIINNEIEMDNKDYFINKYFLPEPPIEFALRNKNYMNAAIDISDGLLQDAGHIAKNSKVGITIYKDKLPLASRQYEEICITGGDDYQLLFTVAPENISHIIPFPKLNQTNLLRDSRSECTQKYETCDQTCEKMKDHLRMGIGIQGNFTVIGKVFAGEGVKIIDIKGQEVHYAKPGYQHF